MRRIIYVYSLVYFITVVVSMAQTPLNPNGGFEETHVGSYTKAAQGIEGWYIWHTSALPPMDAEFYVVESPVKEGKRSLKLILNQLGTLDYHVQAYNEPVPVQINSYYRYSVWVLVDRDSLFANFTVGPLNSTELRRISSKALFPKWQKVSFVFYSGSNETVRTPIHFALAKNGSNLPGTFYIDDMKIVKSPLSIAEVNRAGDTLNIELGWNIQNLPGNFNLNAFTIKVNGTTNPIASFQQKGKLLRLKLTNQVKEADAVTISYNPVTAAITYGADSYTPPSPSVEAFTSEIVENMVGTPEDVPTAIEGPVELAKVNFYPNPVESTLMVEGLENAHQIEIRTSSGQMIKSVNLQYASSSTAVDVSHLERGMYFLNIYTKHGARRAFKFIK